MKKEVIAHKNPKSPISEVFRTLRTNIQFMNVDRKLKVLLITSTFPGEGKSWVASNLAVTFAQAGKKVVIIDSDMRRGRQYAIFGLSPKPGLSNFLSQVEIDANGEMSGNVSDYIQETEVENLYVMTAGNIPPNPSELLVSAQMIKLLDELKSVCDIVIIDGTPSELVTDSVILSRIADSTVIVTAHKITKKDALERVIKNIRNVGGKIAGVVINKVPISAKKYGEKYYYYGEDKMMSSNKKNKKSLKTTEKKKSPNIKETFVNRHEEKPKVENFNVFQEKEEKEEKEDKIIQQPKIKEEKIQPNNNEVEKISIEKTNDILKQINDYLENEKNKS